MKGKGQSCPHHPDQKLRLIKTIEVDFWTEEMLLGCPKEGCSFTKRVPL